MFLVSGAHGSWGLLSGEGWAVYGTCWVLGLGLGPFSLLDGSSRETDRLGVGLTEGSPGEDGGERISSCSGLQECSCRLVSVKPSSVHITPIWTYEELQTMSGHEVYKILF